MKISLLRFQVVSVKIWKLYVPYLYTSQVQLSPYCCWMRGLLSILKNLTAHKKIIIIRCKLLNCHFFVFKTPKFMFNMTNHCFRVYLFCYVNKCVAGELRM